MTPAQQRRFYFPAWTAAARAHGWRMASGRCASHRLECWANPQSNEIYQRIGVLAAARATAEIRALSPDDFRHACHIVAIGHDKSSSDLTNAETDRIVALFRILAHPDSLAAAMAWHNPAAERRKRVMWYLSNRCVESYLVAVCRHKFGTDNWRGLDDRRLGQLHMTIKNRARGQREPSVPLAPSVALVPSDNAPF